MSNDSKSQTEQVKLRHQAIVPKHVADKFLEECKKRRWEPGELISFILEERYGNDES